MKTFKQYTTEKALNLVFGIQNMNKDEEINFELLKKNKKHIPKFMKDLEKMGDSQILFRGFESHREPLILVSSFKNKKHEWYGIDSTGSSIDQNLKDLMKKMVHDDLKIKDPTFVSRNSMNAGHFGNFHLFVPRGKANYFHNPMINDLLQDMMFKFDHSDPSEYEDIVERSAKTYKKSSKPPSGEINEIMVDCKEYWLIGEKLLRAIKPINHDFNYRKYTKYTTTYKELYDSLKLIIEKYDLK